MVAQEGSLEKASAELGAILLRCFEAYMVKGRTSIKEGILMEKEFV